MWRKLFFRKQQIKPAPYGRWRVKEENQIKERKIDLANCDSCCVCREAFAQEKVNFFIVEGDIVQLKQRETNITKL